MTFLAGKVIAVTGAASGIGLSATRLLASRGAVLSLADVQRGPLMEIAESIRNDGGRCLISVIDVRDGKTVDAWIEQTIQEFGRLDGAVNCAGVFRKTGAASSIAEMTDEEWGFVVDINLTGMFKCLRAQLGRMEEGGSVVNISSTAGMTGLPLNAHYCVSKHGIIGLTRSAAKEVALKGIRVNCIAPGAIDTPMLTASTGRTSDDLAAEISHRTPMNRMGSAEEVAKTIAFLLSEDSSFTTGAIYTVDGGISC